ncbi:MAG: ATP:cob(I)alamin adenosyltransferase [Betaproteobacteria bacterium RBG_16_56_24]|nr:MAG: ATP:cob(I)alamin adenosyltransferase [Betaproteobacteria bacterium RBG_16_56_24]
MRLSKITTRTGDTGSTGLADGTRIGKNHARIAALGSVDELNSQLGVLLAEPLAQDIRAVLLQIQNDLFDLGGALAVRTQEVFAQNKIAWLDEQLAHYNAGLPALREFILPGGSRAGALCHVARTVARRAERDLVVLAQSDAMPQHALPYLNRLSDLLFVLSRCINRTLAVTETLWQRDK